MIERMEADILLYRLLKLVVALLLSMFLILLILLRPPKAEVMANIYLPILSDLSLAASEPTTSTIESYPASEPITLTVEAYPAMTDTIGLSPVVTVTVELDRPDLEPLTLILPERAFVGREVSLTGSATPDSQLRLLLNEQVLSQVQVGIDGRWAINTTFDQPGTQLLSVQSLDQGGLVMASSEPVPFMVAAVPTLNLPEKASITNEVIFNGTGEPGWPLQLLVDGQIVSQSQIAPNGQWSASTRFDEPREYPVQVQALDENGTVLIASETSLLLVAVSTPTLNVPIGQQVGTDLSLNGTGEPDSTLQIMINEQVVGSTTVAGDGQWSYNTPINQAGEFQVAVQTLNRHGSVVATSAQAAFSVAQPPTEASAPPEVVNAEPTATNVPAETAIGAPTEAPTSASTEIPTEVPAEVPAEVPTEAPTAVPAEVPTEAPTEAPTAVPTEVPAEVPTEAPTEVPTETPTSVPTEERVLTLWHALPDEHAALLQQIADEWTAQQEGVKIQLEAPDALEQTLLSATASGQTLPTLAFVRLSDTLTYAEANLLLPLDSMLKQETGDLADYYEPFLESVRDPKAPVDNQLMAWPVHRYQTVLFMNDTRASQVGAPAPTSWQALKEACVAHQAQGGEHCWAATPNATTGLLLVASHNGTIWDETGQNVYFREPLEQALRWIEELRAINGVYEASEEDAIAAFAEGKTLFTFASTETIPDYETQINSAFKMVIYPAPSTDGTAVTVATGGNIAIFRGDAESERLAWEFIKYWTSSEPNARWANALAAYPVRRSALDALMAQWPDSEQKKAAEWLPNVHKEALIWPQIEDALTEAMRNIILTLQTAEKSAKEAENKVNDYLESRN